MRARLTWFSGFVVAGILLLGARPAVAQGGGQVVKLGEGETLTISGFINATMFMNRGFFIFGNGQNAEYAAAAQPATDKTYLDGDVRNTRINFTFNGSPVLGKWSPRGVLEADFFVALNGGPLFKFTEAASFVINCQTQEEVDHYWNKLTAGGGQESQCGWLKDKYGLSWQVTPAILGELLADKDQKKAQRVMQAMLQMKKIDIAALQRAAAQESLH